MDAPVPSRIAVEPLPGAAGATVRCLALLVLGGLAVLGAAPAGAQQMDQVLADLTFTVVDGTTGEPGTVDRLEIDYFAVASDNVLDVEPEGSTFTLPRVPLFKHRAYLVTAWKGGVPYFWKLRGDKLMDKTNTLHVFDTTDDLAGAAIDGLTLVIKGSESLLRMEYLLTVANTSRPQVTIMRRAGTVELTLPAGAAEVHAEYDRGPEPTPVPVTQLGGGRVALQAPLITGNNRIKLTAMVPWTDELDVPVASNLDIKAWSVLTSPETLDVIGYELENDLDNEIPGHQRFKGPELEAGRQFSFRLSGRPATGPAENLFTTGAPADTEQAAAAGATKAADAGGPPYLLLLAGVLVIVIAYALLRRR